MRTLLTDNAFQEASGFTQVAFRRLLAWLDDGAASNGERYLEIRRRLVAYFDRRRCGDPDALADETFNRISRTLEEQGAIQIRPPAKYCYVVARFVLLEEFRHRRRFVSFQRPSSIDAMLANKYPRGVISVSADEQQLGCLERCLQKLSPEQRELVIDYYRDARREKIDRRKDIANRLGITMNALGIRVFRLRETLTACLARCGRCDC